MNLEEGTIEHYLYYKDKLNEASPADWVKDNLEIYYNDDLYNEINKSLIDLFSNHENVTLDDYIKLKETNKIHVFKYEYNIEKIKQQLLNNYSFIPSKYDDASTEEYNHLSEENIRLLNLRKNSTKSNLDSIDYGIRLTNEHLEQFSDMDIIPTKHQEINQSNILTQKKKVMSEKQEVKNENKPEDKISKEFVQFMDTKNSYINPRLMRGLLAFKAPHNTYYKEKLEILNKFFEPLGEKFTSLKGINTMDLSIKVSQIKEKINLEATEPFDLYNGPGDLYVLENLKKPTRVLQDQAAELNKTHVEKINPKEENVSEEKIEVPSYSGHKFIESKHSDSEYLEFLNTTKETIINSDKNENSISPAFLLLAYNNDSDVVHTVLNKMEITEDVIKAFKGKWVANFTENEPEVIKNALIDLVVSNNITEHNEITNDIKKDVAILISSSPENVQEFKAATGLLPTEIKSEEIKQKSSLKK